MTLDLDIARLQAELEQLATFTDCAPDRDDALPEPKRAVTRIVFTRRDLEARAWFKDLARAAGFQVREDALGNTFVRWEGGDQTLSAVGTGSHIDAIPHAGMYDGTVGVLGALEAMRALKRAGFAPHRSVELVLFTSEEPTRFGIGCLGSRVLSGALPPEDAEALRDRLSDTEPEAPTGLTLREVREAAGFHGSLRDVPLACGAYNAWLELHIEQGPLLERAEVDCGVVTAIAGPASYRFEVEGLGGHAGALLMPDRRDALCAASELVLAIERAASEAHAPSGHNDTVATVGTLHLHPGASNAVPSRAALTLDLRDIDQDRRDNVMTDIRSAAAGIAARRGVRVVEQQIHADAPALCSPRLVRVLEEACEAEAATSLPLISRAYHDTSFMARIAPVAMLFVPCRGGVSHRPDEYTTPGAIACGVRVLGRAIAALASE